MPFTLRPIERSCFLCHGSGALERQCFIDMLNDIENHLQSLKHVRFLVDIRGCESKMDFVELVNLAEQLKKTEVLLDGSRWAFLCDSEELARDAATGSILSTVSVKVPVEIAVINSVKEAVAWLPLSETECRDVNDVLANESGHSRVQSTTWASDTSN